MTSKKPAPKKKAEPEIHAVTISHEEPPQIPRAVDPNAGTYALAILSDEEFAARLELVKKGRERIGMLKEAVMEPEVDYGLIPGTDKPTLFKPGAEKLAQMYGLAARLETTFSPGDGEKQPLLKYEASAYLHLGSFDGPVVAVGHGTANGWEKRYRRESDKTCPNCGKAAIIKSKFEPGWYCFPKRGGCGTKFAPDHPKILEQSTDSRGDPVVANDLQNTLLKMAEKRAFVDGILRATASSSLFTQDVAEERDEREAAKGGYDEPVETTPGGAQVNADGEVVEAPPEVRVDTSGLQVGRGGHTDTASQAQVDEVKKWSKALGLGPYKLADEIADVVGGGIDSTMLDGEPKVAAREVLDFLGSMSGTDIGRVIGHLKAKLGSSV